jgi:DNA polymerase
MNYFMPLAKISQDHGKAKKMGSLVIYPIYHPAAALRAGSMMKEFEHDFKRLPDLLKKLESILN